MGWEHDRARVARLSQLRAADDPDLLEARRELKASRAEEYARELIESWPPLSIEQRAKIAAALLAPVDMSEAA